MTTLKIGDRLAYQGRVYYVCGYSPMSVSPRRLLLEDANSRRPLEIAEDELTGDAASGSSSL